MEDSGIYVIIRIFFKQSIGKHLNYLQSVMVRHTAGILNICAKAT